MHDRLAPAPAVALGWRVPDPLDLATYLPYVVLAEVLTDGDASRLQERMLLQDRSATHISGYLGLLGDPLDARDPTLMLLEVHHPEETSLDTVLATVEERSFWFRARNELIAWALGRYFAEARSFLDGLPKPQLLVPGNHDVYLPATQEGRRFPHHFGRFVETDLPEFARDLPAGPFPCVKLRGAVALIAVSLMTAPEPAAAIDGFFDRLQTSSDDERTKRPLLLVSLLHLSGAAQGQGWRAFREDLIGFAAGWLIVVVLVGGTAIYLAL